MGGGVLMLHRAWALVDRTGWLIAIACVAVIGVLVLEQGVTNRTFRVAQLRSCHRLNILRAEDNRSQLHDFELYSLTLTLLEGAVARAPQTESAEARREAVAYLAAIRGDLLGKEWVPLASCPAAVDHPATYRTPTPIPFAKATPPASALTVGPGE